MRNNDIYARENGSQYAEVMFNFFWSFYLFVHFFKFYADIFLPMSIYLYLCRFICIYVVLFVSMSIYLYLCRFICIYVALFVSMSIYLYLV